MVTSCSDKQQESSKKSTQERPNIVYILADDLGFGELGVYGQEKIETPHIDELAKNGMLFTQHYSAAPVCAPARYMLLTGQHAGHSQIRGNDAWSARGDVWDFKAMELDSTLEGQRPINEETVLFPEKLQEQGYKTAIIGKWGLGAPQTQSIPTKKGFDYFYGYNCQRQAHNYYPLHLYENENRVYIDNDTIIPHEGVTAEFDASSSESYHKYASRNYAPELMFNKMISFIDAQKEHPFFMLWATPLPHVSLQAPQKWVDYYAKKFGDEKPYTGKGYMPSQKPHATYAAMISYLDENVGKLVAHLKETGKYDNTLIIFTSDNGPTYNGGVDPEFFNSGGPFEGSYGRGKGFVYEGGLRVPMIASWPNKIEAGTKSTLPSSHYDVGATLGELTGYKMPIAQDGVSFLSTLLKKGAQKNRDFLYWEFPSYGGQVAVRKGDWKLIIKDLNEDSEPKIELYNLERDQQELENLAFENPEILKEFYELIKRERSIPENENFRLKQLNSILNQTDQKTVVGN